MATLLPPAKSQFFDALGNPLAGGSVAFFIPGTTTPSNTWQDAGQTTLNTNPIILDSAGEALIYGNGSYRQIVKDSLGNTIWDQITSAPGLQTDIQSSGYLWGGTSSGGANIYNITLPTLGPTLGSYVAGQSFEFFTHQANTGAAVINISGLGAKSITKNGSVALIAGDIVNAQIVRVTLDPNLNAELISAPGSLALTAGTGLLGTGTVVSLDPSYQQGNIGGLITSFNSATILNIALGYAVSDDNTAMMKLASAYTKTTASWAVGTASGALDTGSVANNTGYHVFLIQRPDTGVVDVLFSASFASPTMPANYTKKRWLWWFKTDNTASILSYTQVLSGRYIWGVSINETSGATGVVPPVANRSLLTLGGVPVGPKVAAQLRVTISSSSGTTGLILTSPDETDQAASSSTAGFDAITSSTTVNTAVPREVMTNATAQIGYRASAVNMTLFVSTYGWSITR